MKLLLLALFAAFGTPQEPAPAGDEAELLAALALMRNEREECLALALRVAMRGDCEAALDWIDAAGTDASDELGRRLVLERQRLSAWIDLRDAFLTELAESGRPLTLELDGKKVTSPISREGDELVLQKAKGRRVAVRALAPETLLAAIPKERLTGADEWLKIYPYCVGANPKWKRLTTSDDSTLALERDAESFYPRIAALGPVAEALEDLARRAPPEDAAGARATLESLEALLALGREETCLKNRAPALEALARRLLARASEALGVAELTHAALSEPAPGVLRLAYDFAGEQAAAQARDWRREDGYLAELRPRLEPVTVPSGEGDFAPGPRGFAGHGEACWSHALEFQAPLRVSYRVRWEPSEGQPNKVFAFALGMFGDERERHLRVHELGFLYVDEQDGRYLAVRPSGDAVVQLGQTYAVEIVHDGEKVAVRIDGVLRSEGAAETRTQGRVFLWVHSDLLVAVPGLEIEGRVAPASLARLRAEWAQGELARLGLAPGR